jgi:hypothetical protein
MCNESDVLADVIQYVLDTVEDHLNLDLETALSGRSIEVSEPAATGETVIVQLAYIASIIANYDRHDRQYFIDLHSKVAGESGDFADYTARVTLEVASRYPTIGWRSATTVVMHLMQDLGKCNRRLNGLPRIDLYTRAKPETLARLIRTSWSQPTVAWAHTRFLPVAEPDVFAVLPDEHATDGDHAISTGHANVTIAALDRDNDYDIRLPAEERAPKTITIRLSQRSMRIARSIALCEELSYIKVLESALENMLTANLGKAEHAVLALIARLDSNSEFDPPVRLQVGTAPEVAVRIRMTHWHHHVAKALTIDAGQSLNKVCARLIEESLEQLQHGMVNKFKEYLYDQTDKSCARTGRPC